MACGGIADHRRNRAESTTLLSSSLWLTLAVMCIVGFFQFGAGILYWAIPPTYLRKDQAAVGIALISSLGVIGGFVSPTLLGLIKTYTGSLDNRYLRGGGHHDRRCAGDLDLPALQSASRGQSSGDARRGGNGLSERSRGGRTHPAAPAARETTSRQIRCAIAGGPPQAHALTIGVT